MSTLSKKLNNGLKNRVAVYVPSTINVSEKIDNSEYVNYTLKKLASLFGGCTTINTFGSYVSNDSQLINEKITIVYSYCQTLDNEIIDQVLDLCDYLKQEMNQECISLEINDSLHFI